MKGIVSSIAAVAFVLASAASVGCGSSSSGNPAKNALASLPNAPLNQTTAKQAAGMASTAASGVQSVPQPSDYTGVGSLPSLPLQAVAASNIPLQQKNALVAALSRVGTQVVTPGCPTVTDNSTFPTGTSVDITIDAGTGCTTTTGETLVGKMTLKGTADEAAGAVNLTLTVSAFGLTIACTPGSMTMTMNGSGSVNASGLTAASTSFSVKQKVDITIGFGGTCGGQTLSGSGFESLDASLTGSKTGSIWTFTVAETEGTEVEAGGAKVGLYGDWGGTVTVDVSAPLAKGTIALSGEAGWDNPLYGKGKVGVDYNASYDHSVCYGEPVSGTLQVTSGSDKVVVTFDGNTPTMCGCAPWTLNGAAGVPSPLCW